MYGKGRSVIHYLCLAQDAHSLRTMTARLLAKLIGSMGVGSAWVSVRQGVRQGVTKLVNYG